MSDLFISNGFTVPSSELCYSVSLSGGSGGQHVNRLVQSDFALECFTEQGFNSYTKTMVGTCFKRPIMFKSGGADLHL